MPNINKVVFGNQILIDLSTTTFYSADQLAQGVTAYDRSGTVITGTATAVPDGNLLAYGYTDPTLPLVGVAQVGQAVI